MLIKNILRSVLNAWDAVFNPPYICDDGWTNTSFRDRHNLELRWSRHKTLNDGEKRAWVQSMFNKPVT